MLISADTMISGASTRLSDMPAAFMARSSLFSPKVPSVMTDDSRVARGSDSGIRVALPQPRNSSMTLKLSPLPTSSSMYSHRNCIIRMNMTIKRIAKNGPTKELSMNLSSLFIAAVSSFSQALKSLLPDHRSVQVISR